MKKVWFALAVGAVAGGVLALLYAPRSGPSTRRKLRRSWEDLEDNLNDAADYLKDQAERLGREAQRLIESTQSQVGGVLETTQGYTRSAARRGQKVASRLM